MVLNQAGHNRVAYTRMDAQPEPQAQAQMLVGHCPYCPDNLTRREIETLRLVAMGLTNKEVAEQLSLSVHTVEAHLHSVYGKLQVETRGAAVYLALAHRLI
jgi:DNA-binding NarL/FixJ family response regulator